MKDCQNDKTNQDTTVVGVVYFAINTPRQVKHDELSDITTEVQTKKTKTKFAFPTPDESYLESDGTCFCTRDRILKIYRKTINKTQQKLTEPVEQWFIRTAKQHGWEHASFITDCSARQKAGCKLQAKALKVLPYAATH